jgi:hypothetical protein
MARQALEDVNTFAYNFATLGPIERRYVRQIIPFWGWYKFISGLAYKLPVIYPGRSNILAQLGMIGSADVNRILGGGPPWLAGVLPLGNDKGRQLYLSTMGLNPFSQIFDPVGPEGAAAGALQLGQGSPAIQSILAGFGVDTMRGGEVPISPQSGIAADFLGRYWNTKTGKETDITKQDSGWRILAALGRSFPQWRIGERMHAGGASVYPENVPFLHERPMPTAPENRYGTGIEDALSQIIGVSPKSFDIKKYEANRKDALRYARTRNKNALKKLRKLKTK